jgi:hypothetical protein
MSVWCSLTSSSHFVAHWCPGSHSMSHCAGPGGLQTTAGCCMYFIQLQCATFLAWLVHLPWLRALLAFWASTYELTGAAVFSLSLWGRCILFGLLWSCRVCTRYCSSIQGGFYQPVTTHLLYTSVSSCCSFPPVQIAPSSRRATTYLPTH